MLTISRSPTAQHRRFRWILLTSAVLLAVVALLLASSLPSGTRQLVTDFALVGGGLAAVASCGYRAALSLGRRRRAWILSALAIAVAALGNLWVLAVDITPLPPAAAPIATPAFAVALLLGIGGMVAFPSRRGRGTELLRMILDGVVVGGSALFIGSVTIFPQLLESAASPMERVISLLLPIVDVLLATLAILLFLRGTRTLAMVSTGFILYAISDLSFAVLSAQGPFTFGTPVDLGWIAGYILIALAAAHPAASGYGDAEIQAAHSALPVTIVMFGLFLVAALVSLLRATTGMLNAYAVAMWVAVLLAVASRQILLIKDNEGLRLGLERRVEQRTRELRRATRRNELLLSSVGDGIYGVDRDGLVTFVNPAAVQILGYPSGELVGQPAHSTFHAEQEDGTPYPAAQCYVTEAITLGISAKVEDDVYRRADDLLLPVEVTASPLTNDNEIEGAVVAFRDVTERREMDRLKSEFVSMVSHELRTPLTSVRGSLGLLAGGAFGRLPPAATRMVTIALDSSDRLTRLVNDILDLERIESGSMPLDLADHDAQELIQTAVTQVDVIAAQAGVTVVVEKTRARVRADADSIVRVLINLLGNAIKFSPPGSEVQIATSTADGLVQFRVTDHGRGIPAEKLDRIFTRFEQVDSSDARDQGGSGLGLAISRSLVERHGGRIWAQHGPLKGTIFFFTLPVAAEVDRRPGPGAESAHRDERPTVLVCDDDANVVDVLSAVLVRRGYRPIGVTSGTEAIDRVNIELPDVILLDLIMPGSGGARVLAALRSSHHTRDIPVILISGMGPATDRSLAAQVDGWLIKPIDEDHLTRTVALAIAGHQAPGEVLIIEDDDDLATVIRTLLERAGLRVVHASTGAGAVSYCQTSPPDLIVLDLHLPDGDGSQVVATLRRDGRLAHIPLVVYSAADVADEDKEELRLGPTLFLTKTRVSPQELEDRVLELIDYAVGRGQHSGERRSAAVG